MTRGWPLQRFTTFITDAMIAALIPPQPTPRQARAH
jgi:hypothetical protein